MLPYQRISPEQAKDLLEQKQAQLIDIRDEQSFQQGHIAEASWVNNSNVHDFIANADMDKPLIVYCYHGNSSQSAAAFFNEQGFDDVYSMDGGFELWRQQYPVTP